MEFEEVSGMFEVGPAAWAERAVGADLREAAREHVLEEACEKGWHGKRGTARLTSASMSVAEGDAVCSKRSMRWLVSATR